MAAEDGGFLLQIGVSLASVVLADGGALAVAASFAVLKLLVATAACGACDGAIAFSRFDIVVVVVVGSAAHNRASLDRAPTTPKMVRCKFIELSSGDHFSFM